MSHHSARAQWNTANARLANKPFENIFQEQCKHRATIVLREFFYGNRQFTLERCEQGCDELLICEKLESGITRTTLFVDMLNAAQPERTKL
jgi:hypothetical protein